MDNEKKYNYNLEVGDQITIVDPKTSKNFIAKVVGADHYNELAAAPDPDNSARGLKNSWVSYTLTAEDAPEAWGNRFWAVDSQKDAQNGEPRMPDVERAFYVSSKVSTPPDGFVFEGQMSGRVDLTVVGEALHSKKGDDGVVAQGSLSTYRHPQLRTLWAEEVFTDEQGAPERMVFDVIPDVNFKKLEV